MTTNRTLRRHWVHISSHFGLDAVLFCLALLTGIWLRFGDESYAVDFVNWPFIAVGSIVLSSCTYIFGLYSTHSSNQGLLKRALILLLCNFVAICLLVATTYIYQARPLGRGVMFLSGGFSYLLVFAHHVSLLHVLRNSSERVAYVVTGAFDELEMRLFNSFGGRRLDLVGVVEYNGYTAKTGVRVLGKTDQLSEIVRREKISRVLCTNKSLKEIALCRLFCQLRYSGVTVMPLINLCEEIDQFVPLELVTPEWLLNASGEPHLLYIKKVKRLTDIIAALLGLILTSPVLILAMLSVKLTSRGPIFYRQVRSGRFGRNFSITKLRTMCVDAEKHGAVWCDGHNDPRITIVGRFLRKYRIDELPQLVHVFFGDMSFVGPRPERPEIIEQLAQSVPHYHERLMVQPGITGWAQVSFPYGASIEDTRRKLEYDLYYMKNMSVFLDIFILLDTVRIVLCGGALEMTGRSASRREAVQEWQRLTTEATIVAMPAIGMKSA